MAAVHEVAAKGFSLQTDIYEAVRPGYPLEAIQHLAKSLDLDDGQKRVLDLAAGTGKLTRQLIKFPNWELSAAEPNDAMRSKFSEGLPQVPIVNAIASELPFGDDTFDAIFIGQAFHWFADAESVKEMHRVLKPGGGALALLWNQEDPDEPWVRDMWELYKRYNSHLSEKQHIYGTWRAVFQEPWVKDAFREVDPPCGTVLSEVLFRHSMPTTKQQAWERTLSKSYIATLPQAEQQRVRDELFDIMGKYPGSWTTPGDAAGPTSVGDAVGVLPLRLELVSCRKI